MTADLGLGLVDTPDVRAQVSRAANRRLTVAMLTANTSGAVVVFVFTFFLLPLRSALADQQSLANVLAFGLYVPFSVVVGKAWGGRISATMQQWLDSDGPPDDAIRADLLALPLQQTRVNATMWLGALVVFSAVNAAIEPITVLDIASTVLLGGLATCGVSYLLCERYLRPAVSLAMLGSPAAPRQLLGVRPRLVLAWALGSGIPFAGLLLGVSVPTRLHPPLSAKAVAFLAVVGLVVGLVAILTAAGAVGDPVRQVAQAMRAVGAGDLGVAVPVYDASEVGQLQSGFNTMVAGLRERDRVRDLFGRQVGDEVAALALTRGVQLGGELREVGILFVDVVGSTALAQSTDPQEVVRLLNAFFAQVIDVVTAEGGWVNKFEGDAALCVFGAPAEREDPVSDALAAGRRLALALRSAELTAAVGVSAGQVVAGNVGAESRFEYTVIGDPVNAAARLTELAKAEPSRVLADAALLRVARADEATRWIVGEDVLLRGRTTPTALARPR